MRERGAHETSWRADSMTWLLVLAIWTVSLPAIYAQGENWRYREATAYHLDKLSPEVQIDRWGHEHLVYVSQNTRGAGFQIYYTSNATGRFTSPILATNFNGTVFDSTNASFRSHVFRLDAQERTHIAFLANVANELRIYYTTNQVDLFTPPVFVTRRSPFDMAVDSLGTAHIVWVENTGGKQRLRYWNSTRPGVDPEIIELPVSPGVRLGDPQVEVGSRGLTIAVRSDSSVVLLAQQQAVGAPFDPVQRLVLPTYDPVLTRAGLADLRIRMALDTSGRVHILAPHYDTSAQIRHRLVYLSNASGVFAWRYLTTDTLDTAVSRVDIASNGGDRLAVTWTTEKYRKVLVNLPKVSYLELGRPSNQPWQTMRYHADLNSLVGPEFSYWKNGIQISSRGDRVAIGGLRRVHTDSADYQVGIYIRTSLGPRISYLHPDAAAAGMNVVVESYADVRERGSFGPDGLRPDAVALELVNPGDAARVVPGPTVISWDGRLASTMLFVRPGAQPGPVPLRLRVDGMFSNVDTFFVVTPQHLGHTGRLSGGGMLGSGGIYGRRSKRGVLVVDSLVLSDGLYRIDTSDIDPGAPGNQGFLPITILSLGPVLIDSGAALDASGWDDPTLYGTAGPGGGGGGSGGEFGSGSGYTGGGGPGRFDGPGIMGASVGSGGVLNGRWIGGPSLNGVSGGATFMEAASGGGTGHPFGASGSFGQVNATTPLVSHAGGYGAGSGGSKVQFTTGGGGGGYRNDGIGGGIVGEGDNPGHASGNRQVVPLAGGSGGGGGGAFAVGVAAGGGGGGALAIMANRNITVRGLLRADGGDGIDGAQRLNASGGGAGSGGSVLLGAKGTISVEGVGLISARGGRGGAGQQGGYDGGNGSDGRVRIDGRPIGQLSQIVPASGYTGPATVASTLLPAQAGTVIRGYGEPGRTIRIFTRPENGVWSYGSPRDVTVRTDGTWSLTLDSAAAAGEKIHIVALQRVDDPSSKEFTAEPQWVMSSAGGNLLGRPSVSLAVNDVRFPCIRFDSCMTIDLPIDNPATISDLTISKLGITGVDEEKFATNVRQLTVAAGGRGIIRVTFCPQDTGSFSATLMMPTNVTGADSLKMVTLTGCAVTGHLAAQPATELDLGDMCIGSCRDTSVVIRNDGAAALDVRSIRSEDGSLSIEVLDRPLPLSIQPGDSVRLRLRFCVQYFDNPTFAITVRSTAVDSLTTLIVRARNVGPAPQFPAQIDFGTVTVGTDDSCAVQSVTIRNRSTTVPFPLQSLLSTSTNFTILDPISRDTVIAPGQSYTLRLRFCAGAAGEYSAQLLMGLGAGDCRLDTAIRLIGHAVPSGPRLVVTHPESHSIIFTPTLLGQTSPSDSIVIENLGGTPGAVQKPQIVAGAGTIVGEIVLDEGSISFPYMLAPQERIILRVALRPVTLGSKRASILLGDDGDWSDTVDLYGSGVEPGIQVNVPRLNFREVRVGTPSAPQEILVYNVGSAPVVFDHLSMLDSTQFTVVSVSRQLPTPIAPGNDTVRLRVVFTPSAEGIASDSLVIFNSSAQTPSVQLVGTGVLEHIGIDRSEIDFGCIEGTKRDTINVFTIRNTGTYPLVIESLPVLPVSASTRFLVLSPKLPDTLKPGGSRSYSMRYITGSSAISARLLVKSSAPEALSIDLIGDVCLGDGSVSIVLADTRGTVGSTVMLPIVARFDPLPDIPLEYSLTLRYDWDLLAPKVAKGSKAATLNTAGTLSSKATMTETTPGTLIVSGTLDTAAGGEVLVNIPIDVLLGKDYTSPLAISEVRLLPAGYKVYVSGATFQALDCDTSGGIEIAAGKYALKQNVPNPVEQGTIIHYEIPRNEHVRLNIYDAMGTFITALIDEEQPAGEYDYRLDARDLGSGVYTYEFIAGPFRKTYRLVITE